MDFSFRHYINKAIDCVKEQNMDMDFRNFRAIRNYPLIDFSYFKIIYFEVYFFIMTTITKFSQLNRQKLFF